MAERGWQPYLGETRGSPGGLETLSELALDASGLGRGGGTWAQVVV